MSLAFLKSKLIPKASNTISYSQLMKKNNKVEIHSDFYLTTKNCIIIGHFLQLGRLLKPKVIDDVQLTNIYQQYIQNSNYELSTFSQFYIYAGKHIYLRLDYRLNPYEKNDDWLTAKFLTWKDEPLPYVLAESTPININMNFADVIIAIINNKTYDYNKQLENCLITISDKKLAEMKSAYKQLQLIYMKF